MRGDGRQDFLVDDEERSVNRPMERQTSASLIRESVSVLITAQFTFRFVLSVHGAEHRRGMIFGQLILVLIEPPATERTVLYPFCA